VPTWRDVLTRWLSAASVGVVGAGFLVAGPGGPAVAAARAHCPAPWSQVPAGLRNAVGHALGPVQEAELAASGSGIATFGVSVAISGNGVVAVVGAVDQQLVYVFTRSGRGWRQAAELTASDGASEDGLGQSVAISPDGGTVVAAAMSRDTYRGAVYVFTGPGWRQQSELTASDPAIEDFLGWSVATSSAGDEVLAGAVGHGSSAGAVYVFTRRGTTWSQQAELTARDGTAFDFFGSSVAISPSGGTLLIGASQKNTATGAAYVFIKQGTNWRQATEMAASDGAIGDSFGTSVAISAAGSTAIIGAPEHNAGDGAAYIIAGLPSR
jgi:hypothetical protein